MVLAIERCPPDSEEGCAEKARVHGGTSPRSPSCRPAEELLGDRGMLDEMLVGAAFR
jgi:hypothetical protein